MISFSTIKSIDPDVQSSWCDDVFLTIDIDWACDEVLSDTIDLVEDSKVHATWFVTHTTPLLGRLRSNPKFELGIHPNFNSLLDGDSRNGKKAEDIIDSLLTIVPEAKSIRSHSMTQSTRLLDLIAKKGLSHDCNHFIPAWAGIELKPWRFWNSIIKAPYFWEDDGAFISKDHLTMPQLKTRRGIKIFDFHPIHVFLNTESLDQYDYARPFFSQPDELIKLRTNHQRGTRNLIKQLLEID